MKKSLVGVILALSVFFRPIDVLAASSCSYSEQAELNNIAANVKATYDVVDVYSGELLNPETLEKEASYNKGLKINILNVTDEISIKVINNSTKEEKNYTSKDAQDGIITFDHNNVDSVTTYNIEIYANKYSCSGDLIRKLDFIAPQYNFYSQLAVCEENPEFYYCQEFLLEDNISYDTFIDKYEEMEDKKVQEEEKKNEEKSFLEKIKEFYKKNKLVINITGSVIVVGGLTTAIILIKKRRSRVL